MEKRYPSKRSVHVQTSQPDFSSQTPKIAIRHPRLHPLYEKAFLTPSEADPSEYAPNTTHWDR